ncbi:MAG: tetratricopeptide repeat protein [Candidatus Methylomirabilia bacterium]
MNKRLAVAALLIVLTLLTFARVVQDGFLAGFDDNVYVLENTWVRQGLTPATIRWAFTATDLGFWHPLTWLSHMLDVELYGLNSAGHHVSAILLHSAATVVLFLVLQAMTGALWRSALVAALFSVHPLHVESVAWIAERKDVLCALFWFLGLGAYLRYVRKPALSRLVVVFAAYVAALMAKSMAVTFPFALLLLDVWPLGRLRLGAGTGTAGTGSLVGRRQVWLEKLPMFLLIPILSIVSYQAQVSYGAISGLWANALWIRGCNAVISYGSYLVKTVLPTGLATYYPHPGSLISIPKAAVSGIALLIVTALCVRTMRSKPYLAVGWFWYLGTLVPVIGFIEYGQFAMADRYTYLPLVGIFMAAVWGCGDLCEHLNVRVGYRHAAAVAVVLVYAAAAWVQTGYWRDEVTLWTRTVEVTGDNIHARIHLGSAWKLRGEPERAAVQYREAIRLNGNLTPAMYLLAEVLEEMGRNDEAAAERAGARELDLAFQSAMEVSVAGNSGQGQSRYSAKDHNNAGVGAALTNKFEEAEAHFRKALELAPDYAGAHYNLANLYRDRGRPDAAYAEYQLALRYDPGLEAARVNLKALESKRR